MLSCAAICLKYDGFMICIITRDEILKAEENRILWLQETYNDHLVQDSAKQLQLL